MTTQAANGGGRGPLGVGTGYLRLALLVARRDYLRTVRRRGFVFGTLLLPLGIAALIALSSLVSFTGPGTVDPSSIVLVVVNESTVKLPQGLGTAPAVELVTRKQGEELLRAGRIADLYVVPVTYPQEARISRIQRDSTFEKSAIEMRAATDQALMGLLRMSLLAREGLTPQALATVVQPIVVVPEGLDGQSVSDLAMAASFAVPLLFTLLFVMSIFITSGYLLQSVTEEKENRVVEIVLSSIPALPLMAGKVLGLGGAGLTQVAVWLVTALLAIPLLEDRLDGLGDLSATPIVLMLAVVYFLLGYLSFGAIFAAIGALAPGNREAQQYSGFFGFIAVVPLIFSTFLISDAQSAVAWILALFPLTAPATMLQVLIMEPTIPWPMVVGSLTSLILFVAWATLASARIFRATVLLYGVRPSVRQLLSAVRSQG